MSGVWRLLNASLVCSFVCCRRLSVRLCSDHEESCVQIKYIARVLRGTSAPVGGEKRPFFDYLLTALRDRSDMVTFQVQLSCSALG